MSDQLDILAFEPFYGGFRREMLETLARHSRHRWKILKLPPRRLERRLTTAARWFTEQMHRHAVGHFDVLFSSEALNLADLFRLAPELARKPAVVYFHSHQLGDGQRAPDSAHDYANLSSAAAATELWFISKFGRRDFFATAQALIARDMELSTQDVLPALTLKAHVVPPPVESDDNPAAVTQDQCHQVLVKADNADVELINAALDILERREVKIRLMALGSIEGLSTKPEIELSTRSEPSDRTAALKKAGAYLSVSPSCVFDELAIRAMNYHMNVAVPRAGGYIELLANNKHAAIAYAVDPDSLATAMQTLATADCDFATPRRIETFDPIQVTRRIDDRLAKLAAHRQ